MKILNYALLIIVAAITSCKSISNETDERATDLLMISQEQFTSEGMELGIIKKHSMPQIISCTGKIMASPNGRAEIALAIAGVIKKVNVTPGQKVTVGMPLLEIEGNDLIDLQKEFANASANFKRFQNDYNRAIQLNEEGIGSQKEFLYTESEFKKAQAEYHSLELKVKALKLDKQAIESGQFVSSCSITSPIKGVVNDVEVFIGNYVSEGTRLLEIVDETQFQLKIFVFQNNIEKTVNGLPVEFKFPDNSTTYKAQLTSIGSTINSETKAVECYAKILEAGKNPFVHNAYVEVNLITGQDSLLAIPLEALIKSDNGYKLLKFERKENDYFYFSALPVKTGRVWNNLIELTDYTDNNQVLVKGAYNIILQ